jgi:hypothetical protein
VRAVRRGGNRLLAQYVDNGAWTLWDTDLRTQIARGNGRTAQTPDVSQPFLAIAGGTLAVEVADGIELRNAADGSLRTTVRVGAGGVRGLASDGSYLWRTSDADLRVWRADGSPLVTLPGAYGRAKVLAGPEGLRVALGPRGNDVVEMVSAVDGGARTLGKPFAGQFQFWFADGARFLTQEGSGVWIYSKDADLAMFTAGTGTYLGGSRDILWASRWQTRPNSQNVQFFEIDFAGKKINPEPSASIAVPTASGIQSAASPDVFMMLTGGVSGDRLAVARLTTPVQVTIHAVPSAEPGSGRLANLGVPSIDEAGRIAISTTGSFVFDESVLLRPESAQSYTYTCGAIVGLAASARDGAAAVLTKSGVILGRLGPAHWQPLGQLPVSATKAEVSFDGKTLALWSDLKTSVYGFDDGRKLGERPLAGLNVRFEFLDLMSGNGQRFSSYGTSEGLRVSDLTDTIVEAKSPATIYPAFRLSPAGKTAVSRWSGMTGWSTDVYGAGALLTAIPGQVAGWLDEDRVVTTTEAGVRAYRLDGHAVAGLTFPQVASALVPVDGSRALVFRQAHETFEVRLNSGPPVLWDLAAGRALWTAPAGVEHVAPVPGGVAYVEGTKIVVEAVP